FALRERAGRTKTRKEYRCELSGFCVLSSRKLVWIVREKCVDAEGVEEVRHLVADAGEAGLLVRAEGPRRHGEAGGVRALYKLGMTRDDEFLRRNAGRKLCQLADARLR